MKQQEALLSQRKRHACIWVTVRACQGQDLRPRLSPCLDTIAWTHTHGIGYRNSDAKSSPNSELIY